MPKKSRLVVSVLAFLAISAVAVIVNSFALGHGWTTGCSISRYVGFEMWSAVVFALGNFFAAGATGTFLWRLGGQWKMPRIYYYAVMMMVLGLVGLSLCPIGLCDFDGQKSIVSLVHEFSSRTMFIMMMTVAGLLATRPYGTEASRLWCIAYVIYGLFCVVGYLTHGVWFEPWTLIFEILYIAGFVVVLLNQHDKRELR